MMMRLMTVLALSALSLLAADVTGTWKATIQTDNGSLDVEYKLQQEAEKVTGTASSSMGSVSIHSGTITGDAIVFTVSTDRYDVVHRGTVAGNEMTLRAQVGSQELEVKAKKAE
jgi:hypothetical protein